MTLNAENNHKKQKIFYYLLFSTLILWWSGLFGADLYALPSLVLIIYLFYLIHKGFFPEIFSAFMKTWYQWSVSKKGIKCFLVFFFIQGLIWIVYPVLKYYSFNLFTLDAGYHSNILYNISKGDFYSSIFNMQSLGEHFTFSMSFISLFYLLVPSINLMMGFKEYLGADSIDFGLWYVMRNPQKNRLIL